MRCAIVNAAGLVENVILANPDTDTAPGGYTLHAITEGHPVSPGWTWSGSDFISPPEPLVPPFVPESITRRQCALQLLAAEMITGPEALAMAKDGTPPDVISAYFSQMDADSQVRAAIDFAASNYFRNNPLIDMLMVLHGNQPEYVDTFFIAAAAL